jgi:hypothetical protein
MDVDFPFGGAVSAFGGMYSLIFRSHSERCFTGFSLVFESAEQGGVPAQKRVITAGAAFVE